MPLERTRPLLSPSPFVDEVVILETPTREIAVHMVAVGENVPWAEFGGEVVFGPPHEDVYPEGIQWEVNRYMVLGAYDLEGKEVALSPQEYRAAVHLAESYDSED